MTKYGKGATPTDVEMFPYGAGGWGTLVSVPAFYDAGRVCYAHERSVLYITHIEWLFFASCISAGVWGNNSPTQPDSFTVTVTEQEKEMSVRQFSGRR